MPSSCFTSNSFMLLAMAAGRRQRRQPVSGNTLAFPRAAGQSRNPNLRPTASVDSSRRARQRGTAARSSELAVMAAFRRLVVAIARPAAAVVARPAAVVGPSQLAMRSFAEAAVQVRLRSRRFPPASPAPGCAALEAAGSGGEARCAAARASRGGPCLACRPPQRKACSAPLLCSSLGSPRSRQPPAARTGAPAPAAMPGPPGERWTRHPLPLCDRGSPAHCPALLRPTESLSSPASSAPTTAPPQPRRPRPAPPPTRCPCLSLVCLSRCRTSSPATR